MKDYCIMHLERHVATVRSDGSCTVYYPQFMPYNLYLERAEGADLSVRMENIGNFYYWCASRILTPDRKYAKEIMNALGLKQAVTDRDRAEIAISYHCLSLTDVYWVREKGEAIRYADVNLYEHSLSNAFVDVALCGKSLTAQNAGMLKAEDAAGDVATAGVAPKAWVRRDGTFWLYKDGDRKEVEAELLASRIAQCFRVDQVEYIPADFEGETVSACRLMTSPSQSIVPAEYVAVYAVNHGTSLSAIVQKKDAYGFHMMNVIDYLVGNTDRHWGNWGFYTDNRTNKLTKLHPLMDLNKAFAAYDTPEGARCQTVEGNISQLQAARDAVCAVGLNQRQEVPESWFQEEKTYAMFAARLKLLKAAAAAN